MLILIQTSVSNNSFGFATPFLQPNEALLYHLTLTDDHSTPTPGDHAFHHVMQQMEDVAHIGPDNDEHTYAVELTDDHFEIDGVDSKYQDPRNTLTWAETLRRPDRSVDRRNVLQTIAVAESRISALRCFVAEKCPSGLGLELLYCHKTPMAQSEKDLPQKRYVV